MRTRGHNVISQIDKMTKQALWAMTAARMSADIRTGENFGGSSFNKVEAGGDGFAMLMDYRTRQSDYSFLP